VSTEYDEGNTVNHSGFLWVATSPTTGDEPDEYDMEVACEKLDSIRETLLIRRLDMGKPVYPTPSRGRYVMLQGRVGLEDGGDRNDAVELVRERVDPRLA
jgi:hypothetical protein